MQYWSKTNFKIAQETDARTISDYRWREMIPTDRASIEVPHAAGILTLLDSEKRVIRVATSKNMKRRVKELLYKSNGRFDGTVFVQFAYEFNYQQRFENRHMVNCFILANKAFKAGKLENVLEDNDPKLLNRQYA